MKVRVTPGEGLVARSGDGLLLVLPGGEDASVDALQQALEETCNGQPTPGRALARRLVGFLVQAEPSAIPPFAALAPTEEGWAVTLHGPVEAHSSDGQHFSGSDAATWVDRILPGGFEWLTVDAEGGGPPSPGRLTLDGGTSYGGGLLLELSGTPTATAPAAAPPVSQAPPAAATPAAAQAPPAAAPPQAAPPQAPPGEAAPTGPVGQPPQTQAPPGFAQPPTAPAPTGGPPGGFGAAPTPAPAPPAQDHAGHDHGGHDHGDAGPSTEPLPQQPQPAAAAVLPPPPLAAPPQSAAAPPQPAPQAQAQDDMPAADVPFRSISLLQPPADLEARAPLPVLGDDGDGQDAAAQEMEDAVLVDGILCERGHFNHPYALYCSSCGVSTVHRTRATVQGPRPTLGVVVTDDGVTYSLDSDYLVGREPEQDPLVKSGEVRFMKLTDPDRSISRVHAEIRLKEWDVYIVDRGSANGTFVAGRDETQWTRLAAGKPHMVMPGTRIAFGRRVMTYDTHHQA